MLSMAVDFFKGIWKLVAFVVIPATVWFTTINLKADANAHRIEAVNEKVDMLEAGLDKKQDKILEQLSQIKSSVSWIKGRMKESEE